MSTNLTAGEFLAAFQKVLRSGNRWLADFTFSQASLGQSIEFMKVMALVFDDCIRRIEHVRTALGDGYGLAENHRKITFLRELCHWALVRLIDDLKYTTQNKNEMAPEIKVAASAYETMKNMDPNKTFPFPRDVFNRLTHMSHRPRHVFQGFDELTIRYSDAPRDAISIWNGVYWPQKLVEWFLNSFSMPVSDDDKKDVEGSMLFCLQKEFEPFVGVEYEHQDFFRGRLSRCADIGGFMEEAIHQLDKWESFNQLVLSLLSKCAERNAACYQEEMARGISERPGLMAATYTKISYLTQRQGEELKRIREGRTTIEAMLKQIAEPSPEDSGDITQSFEDSDLIRAAICRNIPTPENSVWYSKGLEALSDWDGTAWPQKLVDCVESVYISRGDDDIQLPIVIWQDDLTGRVRLNITGDSVEVMVEDVISSQVSNKLGYEKVHGQAVAYIRYADKLTKCLPAIIAADFSIYPRAEDKITPHMREWPYLKLFGRRKRWGETVENQLEPVKKATDLIWTAVSNYHVVCRSPKMKLILKEIRSSGGYNISRQIETITQFANKIPGFGKESEEEIPWEALESQEIAENRLIVANFFRNVVRPTLATDIKRNDIPQDVDATPDVVELMEVGDVLKRNQNLFGKLSLGVEINDMGEYFRQIDHGMEQILKNKDEPLEYSVCLGLFNKMGGQFSWWKEDFKEQCGSVEGWETFFIERLGTVEKYKTWIRQIGEREFYRALERCRFQKIRGGRKGIASS